jgi:hypothetical protein
MALKELRINMARISGRKAIHKQRGPGWPTQSSGSTWPGYQVGRPLIYSKTRISHADIRISIARISGGKATHKQRGPGWPAQSLSSTWPRRQDTR